MVSAFLLVSITIRDESLFWGREIAMFCLFTSTPSISPIFQYFIYFDQYCIKGII